MPSTPNIEIEYEEPGESDIPASEVSEIEMLDMVLAWFAIPIRRSDNVLYLRLTVQKPKAMEHIIGENPELNSPEFRNLFNAIVDKLDSDGYLSSIGGTTYTATIEGRIFYKQGGYAKEQKDIIQKACYQKSMADTVYRLTWVIALGTLVAGIYYGVELVRWLCHSK